MRIPKSMLPAESDRKPGIADSRSPITSLGSVPWNRTDVSDALDAFLPMFERRPIRDNQGGMRSVGLFNVWFLLSRLRPQSVLESGIWKGQSTWLIEETLSGAEIVSIDINLPIREYVSCRARYSDTDFLKIDLRELGWKRESSLAFFDDHQDVIPRMRKCQALGIKHIILDDNYPEFLGARHISAAAILNDRNPDGTSTYTVDRQWLLANAEAYYLCPSIFDYLEPLTMEKSFIKEPSLLGRFDPSRHSRYDTYFRDLPEYRWTTYVRLK